MFLASLLGSCYVAQGGFKLTLLLPQPPLHWDYRLESLHLTQKFLGIEAMSSWSMYLTRMYILNQNVLYRSEENCIIVSVISPKIPSSQLHVSHTVHPNVTWVGNLQSSLRRPQVLCSQGQLKWLDPEPRFITCCLHNLQQITRLFLCPKWVTWKWGIGEALTWKSP